MPWNQFSLANFKLFAARLRGQFLSQNPPVDLPLHQIHEAMARALKYQNWHHAQQLLSQATPSPEDPPAENHVSVPLAPAPSFSAEELLDLLGISSEQMSAEDLRSVMAMDPPFAPASSQLKPSDYLAHALNAPEGLALSPKERDAIADAFQIGPEQEWALSPRSPHFYPYVEAVYLRILRSAPPTERLEWAHHAVTQWALRSPCFPRSPNEAGGAWEESVPAAVRCAVRLEEAEAVGFSIAEGDPYDPSVHEPERHPRFLAAYSTLLFHAIGVIGNAGERERHHAHRVDMLKEAMAHGYNPTAHYGDAAAQRAVSRLFRHASVFPLVLERPTLMEVVAHKGSAAEFGAVLHGLRQHGAAFLSSPLGERVLQAVLKRLEVIDRTRPELRQPWLAALKSVLALGARLPPICEPLAHTAWGALGAQGDDEVLALLAKGHGLPHSNTAGEWRAVMIGAARYGGSDGLRQLTKCFRVQFRACFQGELGSDLFRTIDDCLARGFDVLDRRNPRYQEKMVDLNQCREIWASVAKMGQPTVLTRRRPSP